VTGAKKINLDELIGQLDRRLSEQGSYVSVRERNLKLDLVGFLTSDDGRSSLSKAVELTKRIPRPKKGIE